MLFVAAIITLFTSGVFALSADQQVKLQAHSHTLRICNAFPYEKAFSIYHNRDVIEEESAFKTCKDFAELALRPGDHIRFKDGSENAGIFQIGNMPAYPSTLLLVVSRHDGLLDSVKFDSHVFKNLPHAQVAVINTYKGALKAEITIEEHAESDEPEAKLERLSYGGVHKLNNGYYDIKMFDVPAPGIGLPTLSKKKSFVVLPAESYVILRTGVEDKMDAGNSYVEDFFIFPQSDLSKLVELSPGAMAGVSIKYLLAVILLALLAFAVARQFIKQDKY